MTLLGASVALAHDLFVLSFFTGGLALLLWWIGSCFVRRPSWQVAVGLAAQGLFHTGFDLQGGLGIARRQREGYLDRAVEESGGADDAERHDVAAEAGILHAFELFLDLIRSHEDVNVSK